MNLLESFSLNHTQITNLHAELRQRVTQDQRIQAKIELNLTPKELSSGGESGLPSYQITVSLTCIGELEGAEKPAFTLQVVMQANYQQIQGESIDLIDFTQHHGSFTRQLYPLAHQHLRAMTLQLGLEQVRLPYDLLNTGGVAVSRKSLH